MAPHIIRFDIYVVPPIITEYASYRMYEASYHSVWYTVLHIRDIILVSC